jgi:hypothetical protein
MALRALRTHGMELRTPLITAPAGRYQGAPRSSRPLGSLKRAVLLDRENKES